MTVLKIIEVPEEWAAHRGKKLALKEPAYCFVPQGSSRPLSLPPAAAANARLERFVEQGDYNLIALVDGVQLDGVAVVRGQAHELSASHMIRIGPLLVAYVPDQEQQEVLEFKAREKRTLMEWWEAVTPLAPNQLSGEMLLAAQDLCGIRPPLCGKRAVAEVTGWLRQYLSSRDRASFPLVLPFFLDLASLIILPQPPFRPFPKPGRQGWSPLSERYAKVYQADLLRWLSRHPAVKHVRTRFTAKRLKREDAASVVCKFIYHVCSWAANAWLRHGCRGDEQAIVAGLAKGQDPSYAYGLQDPLDVRAFLAGLSTALRELKLEHVNDPQAFRQIIDPVDRFKLGARVRIKEAFDAAGLEHQLMSECIRSRPLDPKQYIPEPIDRQPWFPQLESRILGNHGPVDRIRKTNRLEQLPEVIPQDAALLKAAEPSPGPAAGRAEAGAHGVGVPPSGGEDGRPLLLNRLMHDGLLIWHRHSHDAIVPQHRFLICYFADVGLYAAGQAGGLQKFSQQGFVNARATNASAPSSTPGVHARRLVFEMLRDLVAHVHLPAASVDVHALFEPLHEPRARRLGLAITLDELRRRMGKTVVYDEMTELEELLPGFFFPRNTASRAAHGDYLEFIHEQYEQNYDFMMFVFLAPKRTLFEFPPHNPPTARAQYGLRDVVRLVELDRSPSWVQSAAGNSFEQVTMYPSFQVLSDQELRYRVLEDLLGKIREDFGDFAEPEAVF